MEPITEQSAEQPTEQNTDKRRGIFKLAFAAPAVLAALPVGAASAHDDDDDDDDDESTSPRASLLVELCTVSEVVATGRQDFVPAVAPNPQHTLDFGGVAVGHHHRHDRHHRHDHEHVFVVLRGARPRTTYEVYFAPHNNAKPRELLGTVTTDRNGNVADEPVPVAGSVELGGRRVGIFVLREAGTQQDQFVTCLHGHHHDHRFWRFFRRRHDD